MILKEQDSLIMIPKAIFELPPEEKEEALKQLRSDIKQYKRLREDENGII